MNLDLQNRLSELASEFERGQAEQPLGQYLAALGAEFRGAHRAILMPVPAAAERPWLPAGEAGLAHLDLPGAPWDWLVVTDPATALADLASWNRLAGHSPLVVIVVEAAAAALSAPAAELLHALSTARKRGVTITVAPHAAPGGVPAAFLPALTVPAFDPATDWSLALKSRPPDFTEQVRGWLEGFAAERAALPLTARLEQARQRAVAQRAVLDQRQTQLMSQRDSGAGRLRVDKARDSCLLALETQEKELAEESRAFLAAKGSGTTKLKTLLDQVGEGIIHEELRPKLCVLTVEEAQVQLLLKQLENLFWTQARESFAQGEAKVAAAFADFNRELKSVLPDAVPPAATTFDQGKVARSLEPVVHTNVSYRGELPVKGFFERIQASRQVVFFVVGLFSLVGASAIARSPAVIMVTLALFSVMLFKTARDFKVEAAEARERELQRLGDQLRTQLRQLLQEMETVKGNAWREHLQAQRRALATALDQALRDAATNQTREMEDERQKVQLKLRGLDKLTRDLGTLEQKLQAVLNPVRQNRIKAELAFSQALRG